MYQITAILILAAFYVSYFAQIVLQKKQSIKTNQMGTGNKPKKVLVIERIMSAATVLVCILDILSIFLVKTLPVAGLRIAGIVIGLIAVIFLHWQPQR